MGPSRARRVALACLVLAGASASPARGQGAAAASDWPGWRGPARDGVSPETGWHDVGREAPLWTREVGLGHSSVAVVGESVYTLGHTVTGSPDAPSSVVSHEDALVRLDLATGAVRWRATWPGELRDNSHDGGTLSTPTVDAGTVFVTSNVGRIAAHDAESGALRWARDGRAELQLEPPTWGFAASPLVLRVGPVEGGEATRLVVVNLGMVVALDAATGALVWRSPRHYGSAYSTPAPFDAGGVQQLAVLCGGGLAVLRASDGGEVAFQRWDKAPPVAPMTPVIHGDRIFVSGGYERGALMLRFADGALTELWESRVMRNKMSGAILVGEHLYGFDEALLKCIDLSGQVAWSHRGLGTGALSVAGGRLVILDGKGQLVVALASPSAYTELSRRVVFEEGTSWSTPVVSHGLVLCRSGGRLVCLDHRRGPDRATAEGRASLERLRAALPSADELFVRHAAAARTPVSADTGAGSPAGAQAPLRALRMHGVVRSVRNTARRGTAVLTWAEGLGFKWREFPTTTGAAREVAAAGLRAELEVGCDASGGWVIGEREVAEALQGPALEALREGGDLARLLDLGPWYPRRAAKGVTWFDHRPCFVVAAATRGGHPSTLYFDVETGRLAGQEGAGLALWTYGEYRAIAGVWLPTLWTCFDADTGEMTSARFERIEVDPALGVADFAPPPTAASLLRPEAEVLAANEALTARHAELLGEWIADSDPPAGPRRRFWIEGGFLQTDRPKPEANRWRGPDERGRMVLLGAEYLTFGLERDAAGRLVALQVYVDDVPRTRLVRPPAAPGSAAPHDPGR